MIVESFIVDDLFNALRSHTCADCGQPFETSRRSRYCALCASLRSGAVGPATVVCPACDVAHPVPVLAPTKLCGPCRLDPVLTLAGARARYDAAQAAWLALDERLQADYAHADEQTRQRYEAAVGLKLHGTLDGQSYSAEQVQAAWSKALARGDALSALLGRYEAASAALGDAQRMAERVRGVEEAIEG